MRKFVLVLMGLMLIIPSLAFAKVKAPDVLDDEKIETSESLSKYKTVGIKLFSFDDIEYNNVDDDEKSKMKRFLKECQEDLAKTIKNNLEDEHVHAVIIEEGDGADKADMIIEGKFTQINLGSAFARGFWGMGSGQAGITVKGSLKDAKSGDTLADFKHENSSGLGNGEKWSMVEREVRDLGDKLAEFIVKLRRD